MWQMEQNKVLFSVLCLAKKESSIFPCNIEQFVFFLASFCNQYFPFDYKITVFSVVDGSVIIKLIFFVQVFQRKDKPSYDRELAIYNQPNFKHANILLFIANNEFPEELQLIFEYHPVGSLYDLLNKQQISMKQFCDIAATSARGEREMLS